MPKIETHRRMHPRRYGGTRVSVVGTSVEMAGDPERRHRMWRWRSTIHAGGAAHAEAEVDESELLEYELTMLQETARVLSSTADVEACYAALVRAAALIVSTPNERSRRASLLRLEGDTLVSVAEY